MHLLSRKLLGEILANFLVAAGTISGIVLLANTVQFVRRYQDFGYDFVALNLPYLAPLALVLALPSAMHVATILCFTRFVHANEYTAARCGGVRVERLLAAPLVAALLVGVLTWVNLGVVAPRCHARQRALKEEGVRYVLSHLPEEARSFHFPLREPIFLSYERYRDGVLFDFRLARLDDGSRKTGARLRFHLRAKTAQFAFDEARGVLRVTPNDGSGIKYDPPVEATAGASASEENFTTLWFTGESLDTWEFDLREDQGLEFTKLDALTDPALWRRLQRLRCRDLLRAEEVAQDRDGPPPDRSDRRALFSLLNLNERANFLDALADPEREALLSALPAEERRAMRLLLRDRNFPREPFPEAPLRRLHAEITVSTTRLWSELAHRWSMSLSAMLLSLLGALVPLLLERRRRVLVYAVALLPATLALFLGQMAARAMVEDHRPWSPALFAITPAVLLTADLVLWLRLRRR